MPLRQDTLNAGFWVGLSALITKCFNFLTTLILAKLLIPADFGIVAICALVVMSFSLFREMGISRALIYQKKNLLEAATTGFYLIILTSAFIYSLVFILAPAFAYFFHDPRLSTAIRLLGAGILISAFSEVPSALMEKEIQFRKTSQAEVLFSITYFSIAVLLAFWQFTYWSLIFGQLAGNIVKALYLLLCQNWRPSMKFDFHIAKSLFGYGKHILGTGVVHFCIRNIDDAFVGKFLSKGNLGAYYLAYRIANFPATGITNVVGKIMFPVYTKLPEQSFDLRNAFLKTLRMTALLSVPASFLIFFFISDFLQMLYGDKWVVAVLPAQIFCFYGLIRSIGSGMGGIFLATGKPKIPLRISLVQLAFLSCTLYPSIVIWGIVGVCITSTFAMLISFILHYIQLQKIIECTVREFLYAFLPYVLYSSIAIGAGKIFGAIFFSSTTFLSFSFELFICTLVYSAMVVLLNREVLKPLIDFFQSQKPQNKGSVV